MADSMVTGRMSAQKKQRVGSILKDEGLSASQAINLMYDRVLDDGTAAFLHGEGNAGGRRERWGSAARFVDALSCEHPSRFDGMSKGDIRRERLVSRGLM